MATNYKESHREKLMRLRDKIHAVNAELAHRRTTMTEQEKRIANLEQQIRETNIQIHQKNENEQRLELEVQSLHDELRFWKAQISQRSKSNVDVGVQVSFDDLTQEIQEKTKEEVEAVGSAGSDEYLVQDIDIDIKIFKVSGNAESTGLPGTSAVVKSAENVVSSPSPEKKQVARKSTGGRFTNNATVVAPKNSGAGDKDNDFKDDTAVSAEKQFMWKCDTCDLSFDKVYKLNEHSEEEHGLILEERFGCTRCGMRFLKMKGLFLHNMEKYISYWITICTK